MANFTKDFNAINSIPKGIETASVKKNGTINANIVATVKMREGKEIRPQITSGINELEDRMQVGIMGRTKSNRKTSFTIF